MAYPVGEGDGEYISIIFASEEPALVAFHDPESAASMFKRLVINGLIHDRSPLLSMALLSQRDSVWTTRAIHSFVPNSETIS